MTTRGGLVAALVVLAAAACAKTQVAERSVLVDEKAPRPAHIFVRDFVAAPEDVPSESSLAEHASAGSSPQQTPEQIALGREIGAELAKALVAEIAAMGLPAVHAAS
jgi:hypothetical protein